MINIREERPQDYNQVYEVVKQAFAGAEHTNGDEQNLVNRLRRSEAYIPELSLVAEQEGKIVGHIMFTRLKAGNTVQLGLAPLSVLPSYQNQGIGSRLIEAGHQIARELGYEFSIVVGHAAYYPRFGYLPAAGFGIKAPFDVPPECFMAINLQGKKTRLNAVVEYSAEF